MTQAPSPSQRITMIMEEAMNRFALAITWLTEKKSSRALCVIGALLAAVAVVSTPLAAVGAPAVQGLAAEEEADTEDLAAEEELATEDEADVEEELATEDEADAEEELATEEEAAEEELATEEEEEAAEEDLLAEEDATAAAARVDDSFNVFTADNDSCGKARFVDYGPGKPGGGNNDDYIRIRDRCKDGFGVRAYAWVNGVYLGKKSNVKGKGSSIVWDPFPVGNVRPKDNVGITVCLINSKGDTTPFHCASLTRRSEDG